jgi:hypothetical protein
MDSTGNLVIWARQRNAMPLGNNDLLLLDGLLLQYDAAWMYCVDDGTVPAQVNKYQMLAQKRRQTMISSYSHQPLSLDSRYPSDTDQWWTPA